MNVSSRFLPLASACLAVGLAAPAGAELIVDFTQDATGTNSFSTIGSFTDSGPDRVALATFTETATVFPLDPGFPVFRGGSRTVWPGQAGPTGTINRIAEVYGNSPDRINVQHGAINGTAPRFNDLMLVFKDDFDALSDSRVGFDDTSSLSLRVEFQGSVSSRTLNWVVKNDGTYYLNTDGGGNTGFGVKTLSNPNAGNWVTFDPNANGGDLSLLDAQTAGGSPVIFNDIEAVGMFWEGQGSGGTATYQFSSLTVDAVAVPIPEPGSLALAGAGAGALLLRRRNGRG